MDTYKCVDTSYDLVILGQNILKLKKKEALFIIVNGSFSQQGNATVMERERYKPDFPSKNNTFPWFLECHLLTALGYQNFQDGICCGVPCSCSCPSWGD